MFNCILFATGLGLSTYGYMYFFNYKLLMKIQNKIGWNSFKAFCYVQNYYDETIVPIIEKEFTCTENEYITYDLSKYSFTKLKPAKDEYPLVIYKKYIDNKPNFKIQYYNKNDNEIKKMDAPFLQVEIEIDGKKEEIHKNLKFFYLEGNILDTVFFKWYMKYWYNKDISDVFTLHIIDNNVEVFSVSSDKFIFLKDNKYEIKEV